MTFREFFPELSEETHRGLDSSGFTAPTDVQKQAIKPALEGKDVLASAKTGSGKTLAFIIPILECLLKEKWGPDDGLGAIVITPTRELAYQIFEVLRLVGQGHQFSAALIIGGKDLKMERKRVHLMNIIICTPGRMQQHMEENPGFYGDNLKMMILDEADRMLEMGFRESLNSIVEFFPKDRQCLLFSATMTSSLEDLALLSMKEPVKVSVDAEAVTCTPESLRQKYTVINLEQKLSMLWAFLKRHKKSKILVFIATCKQVRFINDLFCRMKPGISINALHGGLHQLKRMDIYNKFRDVRHCCLLATDIAARGLDFPEVDWVVQMDCPDDAKTYIHRVGRTARFDRSGRSLLVLMPNEADYMLNELSKKKIRVEEVPTLDKHLFWLQNTVDSHLTRDVSLKEEAKRAFKAYVKSLLNSHFRHMFDLKQLDLKAYAQSIGLEITPRIRILERRGTSMAGRKRTGPDGFGDDETETYGDLNEDDDEDLLEPAKRQRTISSDDDEGDETPANCLADIEKDMLEKKGLPKSKIARLARKKGLQLNKRIVFNKD